MKKSLIKRYHLALAILLGLVLLETVVMLVILGRSRDLNSLVNDLQTTLIVSVLVIFIYTIVIYNLIPVMLKRSLGHTGKIVSEIAHGNYEIDIDGEIAANADDKDMQSLLEGIKSMLRSIHGFDQAKENKIYEHDQRIKQLINILPLGVVIALNNGDISYRDFMQFSLTMNHMVIDGAPGARFLQTLKGIIENFELVCIAG